MKKGSAILGIVTIAICCVAGISLAADNAEQNNDASNNVSIYMSLSNAAWSGYSEDLAYSSKVLDEYVKGNISQKEAMVAMTSLFTITSQPAESINKVSPPVEFEKYHSYTMGTFEYFKAYLWCLAKFYETDNVNYAIQASEYFNKSVSSQKAAKEEIDEAFINLEHKEMERLILEE